MYMVCTTAQISYVPRIEPLKHALVASFAPPIRVPNCKTIFGRYRLPPLIGHQLKSSVRSTYEISTCKCIPFSFLHQVLFQPTSYGTTATDHLRSPLTAPSTAATAHDGFAITRHLDCSENYPPPLATAHHRPHLPHLSNNKSNNSTQHPFTIQHPH